MSIPQAFVATHAKDAHFERGLRSFFEYRDLGIKDATQGKVVAHVIRAAAGRPLTVMFPLITEMSEFQQARSYVLRELHREKSLGHPVPSKVEIGAMMETPSLAYAPKAFFELTDFISVGGNDLKQFFFAADRAPPNGRNINYLVDDSLTALLYRSDRTVDEAEADLVLSTAHKAKGREWATVPCWTGAAPMRARSPRAGTPPGWHA